jgi:hypothetical protein
MKSMPIERMASELVSCKSESLRIFNISLVVCTIAGATLETLTASCSRTGLKSLRFRKRLVQLMEGRGVVIGN